MARSNKKRPDIPVANDGTTTLAPWPQIDRFPFLIGTKMSMDYLGSTYRLCQTGYRQQYVDALDELIEKDPHAYCCIIQRILAVAGGKMTVTAAEAEKGSPRAKRAEEIRAVVEARIREIPSLTTSLCDLLWAVYYGITAAEVHWDARPDGWHITGLGFIHSRRLGYPDTSRWDLRIWDQGAVMPGVTWDHGVNNWQWPTEQFYGIKIEDFPGKFITFSPKVRGDYPTREGLGREIGTYMLQKLMAVRNAAYFVERFSKPFAFLYYNTCSKENEGRARIADQADIDQGFATIKALGIGSLASAVLPDSLKVVLDGPAIKGGQGGISPLELINWFNGEISKAVRGGTLTTDAGDKGARSLGEVHAQADVRNARYDASALSQALRGGPKEGGIVWWLTHLNFPGEEDLCPHISIQVEERTPAEVLKLATELAAAGAPVDADPLAAHLGVKLIEPENKDARRLAPVKPVELGVLTPQSQREQDVYSALEALAAAAGVTLTNQALNALAEVDQEQAAQFVQELLRAAKQPPQQPADPVAQEQQSDKPAKGATKPPRRRSAPKTTPREAATEEA